MANRKTGQGIAAFKLSTTVPAKRAAAKTTVKKGAAKKAASKRAVAPRKAVVRTTASGIPHGAIVLYPESNLVGELCILPGESTYILHNDIRMSGGRPGDAYMKTYKYSYAIGNASRITREVIEITEANKTTIYNRLRERMFGYDITRKRHRIVFGCGEVTVTEQQVRNFLKVEGMDVTPQEKEDHELISETLRKKEIRKHSSNIETIKCLILPEDQITVGNFVPLS